MVLGQKELLHMPNYVIIFMHMEYKVTILH